MRHIEQVITAVIRTGARRATKFVSPTEVIRATRRLYRGRVSSKGQVELSVTIGRPNFAERKFIKACQKAGETFPMRKVRLQRPPVPRARKTKRRR